ncbi:hypothetical protein SNOG_01780 [Parastagonospora nodorum SN15]|uniref:Uncharacterized protein n=1 Tax=Phaeosphaeria nodorum (strain SN15 / ATCC MYA-4574 / FGSC 10173) TaxID=321614 RepID=Q0V2I4_PHANO|nr:hypothetical protein SNOG_01780 [Parastagonospora nodorum SN15]EAT91429.1 hypothetical protein SNOG_01780 [Parastagonospora nodorum SN15]
MSRGSQNTATYEMATLPRWSPAKTMLLYAPSTYETVRIADANLMMARCDDDW